MNVADLIELTRSPWPGRRFDHVSGVLPTGIGKMIVEEEHNYSCAVCLIKTPQEKLKEWEDEALAETADKNSTEH